GGRHAAMFGLMQDRPLLIQQLIEHAALNPADTEIVSRRIEGDIHRYTYRDARLRAKKVAEALIDLGIAPGDRIGTLAWNGYRHFELYYGISGMGAVCHTINPRLFAEQVVYIVNHAEDRLLFVDLNLLPAIEKLLPQFTTVRHLVAMPDRAPLPKDCRIPNLLVYEELIGGKPGAYECPISTNEPRPRSATPRVPPATPKECSTRIAPRFCMPTAAPCPTRSGCRRGRSCCRWCRCSTSMPGACPTAPPWPAPSWCSRAWRWTARASTTCSRKKA